MPTWLWLTGALLLAVAGIGFLVFTDPRRKEGGVGRHTWRDQDPYEASGGDEELMADVTGLGEQQEPDGHAVAAAAEMDPAGWPDLTGVRDRDPQAANPWRGQ